MHMRKHHSKELHQRIHQGDTPDCTVSVHGVEKDMADCQIKALILNEYTKIKDPLSPEITYRLAMIAKKNDKFEKEREQRIDRFRSLLPSIFY